MVFAACIVLLAVATFMFFGWGWAFGRLLRLKTEAWPTTVAVGMAAVVFVGGILNLTRLAYPPALAAVAGIGVLLAIRALWEGVAFERPPAFVAILIAVVVAFTIATQLPPSIYNFHDDYQKYFAYPVRMVETGTVFGSSLSAMGLQALGAQAFLDGFVVAFFPIFYINGVDAVFGLFLCLILATQFAKDRAMKLVCVLSVVFINPQYVNISTLFCGSALIMAMAAVEDPVSLGLLCAALIAMKPIYAVFVAIYFLTQVFTQAEAPAPPEQRRWSRRFRLPLAVAIFLSPWVLLHAPHYLAAFRIHHPVPTPVPGIVEAVRFNIFSLKSLQYGSTAANYTLLVIAFAICGLLCWKIKPAVACCITAVIAFPVFVYVFGPLQYGYEHALRYYVPVAMGLAPAIFGLTSQAQRGWIPLLIAVIPLAAFGPSLRNRVHMELHNHSAASYAWIMEDPDYLEYNNGVLKGPERKAVKALQERVPAGEPILAWINTPFYLDYKRNPVIDIDTAGVAVPWAAIPPARYLIWDYAGFATMDEDDYEEKALNRGAGDRRDSLVTLDFMRRLESMVGRGEVLYNDGQVKVVRLY